MEYIFLDEKRFESANGELVGLDFKFKSFNSLTDKVTRNIHSANLKLLEEMERKRTEDNKMNEIMKKGKIDQIKLKRRSVVMISGASNEKERLIAIETSRKASDQIANQTANKCDEATIEFEAREEEKVVDMTSIVWSISDALRYTV